MTTPYDNKFFDRQSEPSLKSARIIVPLLKKRMTVDSVCDVGCGTGAWLSAWRQEGVKETIGIDGEYVDRSQLRVPSDCFIPHDLSSEEELLSDLVKERKFSLATCVEVAEHLPERRATSFAYELSLLSDTILFSAAVPGQGGENHVNEQWQSYWVTKFNNLGFGADDFLRDEIWDDSRVRYWYRQNLLLFRRGANNTRPASSFDVIHPTNWDRKRTSFERKIERLREGSTERPFDEGLENSPMTTWRGTTSAEQALRKAERRCKVLENEKKQILSSTSWKITAPLRSASRILMRKS
ncbi:class I SAM-dependent methyltransferase [Histidinibacterium aquaticum]|nr:methyltransferase domain-containing protein [Histidinibacterium aquaticum]